MLNFLSLAAAVAIDLSVPQSAWDEKPAPDASVNQSAVEDDIRILLYALREAYGGYEFLPRGAVLAAEDKLRALTTSKSPTTSRALCHDIDQILDSLPDAHLQASLPGAKCNARSER